MCKGQLDRGAMTIVNENNLRDKGLVGEHLINKVNKIIVVPSQDKRVDFRHSTHNVLKIVRYAGNNTRFSLPSLLHRRHGFAAHRKLKSHRG